MVLLAVEVAIVRSICPNHNGATTSRFDECWPNWIQLGSFDSCGEVCIPSPSGRSLNPCCNVTQGCSAEDHFDSDLALACGTRAPSNCRGSCADVGWASIGGALDVLASSSAGMDGAFPQLISVGTLRDQDKGIRLVDVAAVPASAFEALK